MRRRGLTDEEWECPKDVLPLRSRRGSQGPPDHVLGRPRGGFSTELRLATAGPGWLPALRPTAGQTQSQRSSERRWKRPGFPSAGGRARSRPCRAAGDKGSTLEWTRTWLRRRSVVAVVPRRRDQAARRWGRPLTFDRRLYLHRSDTGCCVWVRRAPMARSVVRRPPSRGIATSGGETP
jgi:hypothetical protein